MYEVEPRGTACAALARAGTLAHAAAILQHLLVSQSLNVLFFDLFETFSSHCIEEKIIIFTGIHSTNIIFKFCGMGH